MDQRELQAVRAATRHLQLRRRVKRGIVAGYIHELSARHRQDGTGKPERREALLATPRSA
jgi:hypothetical protein